MGITFKYARLVYSSKRFPYYVHLIFICFFFLIILSSKIDTTQCWLLKYWQLKHSSILFKKLNTTRVVYYRYCSYLRGQYTCICCLRLPNRRFVRRQHLWQKSKRRIFSNLKTNKIIPNRYVIYVLFIRTLSERTRSE